jgi:hypothetical protein
MSQDIPNIGIVGSNPYLYDMLQFSVFPCVFRSLTMGNPPFREFCHDEQHRKTVLRALNRRFYLGNHDSCVGIRDHQTTSTNKG